MKNVVAVALLSLAGCSGDSAHPKLAPFPTSFLWGTATAPYQIEGGLHQSDWYQWESTSRNVTMSHADDGDHSYDLFDTDSALAQSIDNNAMRLGIDFSRLFPTAAQFPSSPDATAVAHYHALFASLKAHGITPMVTLYHWALPIWEQDLTMLTASSGWLDDTIPDKFAKFCGWAGKEYGGEVDLWVTLNEPIVNLAAGYFNGIHPPDRTFADANGIANAEHALRNMVYGHAAAYEALKAADTVDADGDGHAAQVGIAFNMPYFISLSSDNPTTQAEHDAAAQRLRYISNTAFQQAVTHGDFDGDLDEQINGAMDVAADPKLAGHLDWMGLNYYSVVQVSALGRSSIGPITGLPKTAHLDTDNPKTQFGWDIYSPGFRASLDTLRGYGLPIYITENGVADAADAQRALFLADHLYVLEKAIADGIDVRGYFQWSLIDNFEWAAGYCPHFGQFAVDYNDPNRARTPRPSATVYKQIIDQRTVDPALFQQYPSYPAPASYCAGG
jgi:beta-glucosidase